MNKCLILGLLGFSLGCTQEKPAAAAVPEVVSVATATQVGLVLFPGANSDPSASWVVDVLERDLGLPGWFAPQKLAQAPATMPNHAPFFVRYTGLNSHQLRLEWGDASSGQVLYGETVDGDQEKLRDAVHAFTNRLVQEYHQEEASALTWIAYVQGGSKERSVMVMDWDGHSPKAWVSGFGRCSYPMLSPDRSTVYFGSMKPGYPAIYSAQAGSNPKSLMAGQQAFQPRPRPQGDLLLVSVLENGNSDLWTVELGSQDKQRLIKHPASETSAAWSASGNDVWFVSDRGGGPQIYRMDRFGSGLERQTFRGRYNTGPSVSPQGNKLAFSRMEGSQMSLYVLDLASGTEVAVAVGGNNESPSWSPDGKMITFSSDRSGVSQIYVVRADGTGLTQITHGAPAYQPQWSYR